MKSALTISGLIGLALLMIPAFRSVNAYNMDMAVREAREEHHKKLFEYGLPPRL